MTVCAVCVTNLQCSVSVCVRLLLYIYKITITR